MDEGHSSTAFLGRLGVGHVILALHQARRRILTTNPTPLWTRTCYPAREKGVPTPCTQLNRVLPYGACDVGRRSTLGKHDFAVETDPQPDVAMGIIPNAAMCVQNVDVQCVCNSH